MAKLVVENDFPYNGAVRRAGSILTVGDSLLQKEVDKGEHPTKKGRHLSPFVNHCSPSDEAAAKIMGMQIDDGDEIIEDPEDEIDAIRAQFDELGKAYDNRWKLPRLQNELKKAKIEVGA